jgi:hypothetical protein
MYLNMGMMGSPIRRQFPDEFRATVSTAEPHAMGWGKKDWAGPSRPKWIEKSKN